MAGLLLAGAVKRELAWAAFLPALLAADADPLLHALGDPLLHPLLDGDPFDAGDVSHFAFSFNVFNILP